MPPTGRSAARAGRTRTDSRGQKGSRHSQSKLTGQAVREMRRLYEGGRTTVEIGREYGVHYKTVWAIVTRRVWVHVD